MDAHVKKRRRSNEKKTSRKDKFLFLVKKLINTFEQ